MLVLRSNIPAADRLKWLKGYRRVHKRAQLIEQADGTYTLGVPL